MNYFSILYYFCTLFLAINGKFRYYQLGLAFKGEKNEPRTSDVQGSYSLQMAERQGFEPWQLFTALRAFQARPFNHLGIAPKQGVLYRVVRRLQERIADMRITITQAEAGQRVDKFIRRWIHEAPLSFISLRMMGLLSSVLRPAYLPA